MNVKLIETVFAVLSTISLLMALTFFIAGTGIFIFMQLFEYFASQGEFWVAFFVTLPAIPVFACLFFVLIKKTFLVLSAEEEKNKKPHLTEKAVVSSLFLFYEIFKILLKRKSKHREPKPL